jgi:hypothetical protein
LANTDKLPILLAGLGLALALAVKTGAAARRRDVEGLVLAPWPFRTASVAVRA